MSKVNRQQLKQWAKAATATRKPKRAAKPPEQGYLSYPGEKPPKKGRKKPTQEEYKLHTACVKWFDMVYSEIKLKRKRFHVPNRSDADSRRAYFNKQMGAMPGVADLIVIARREGFSGLIVDFKAKGGGLSDEQKEFFESMREEGFRCEEVDSFDRFRQVVTEYLGPSPVSGNNWKK